MQQGSSHDSLGHNLLPSLFCAGHRHGFSTEAKNGQHPAGCPAAAGWMPGSRGGSPPGEERSSRHPVREADHQHGRGGPEAPRARRHQVAAISA